MKSIALLILFSTAALAQDSDIWKLNLPERAIWFHGLVGIGALNRNIDTQEAWAELDITNKGRQPRSLTVTARRYTGLLISATEYTIAPGEKRTIRVDDPDSNVLTADEVWGQYQILANLLIEPVPPEVTIVIRQLNLHGDKLLTALLETDNSGRPLRAQTFFELPVGDTTYTVTNIGGETAHVLSCKSRSLDHGCDTPTVDFATVLPYGAVTGTVTHPDNIYKYMRFLAPKEAIICMYRGVTGTTKTFNANSSITFGNTVPEKKE
jgi:hypothetical protein